MKFIKNNFKLIVGIMTGAVLISGISVYATTTYMASQVTYKDGKSVEYALNDLYKEINKTSMLETEVISKESSVSNQTKTFEKGEYKSFLLSTYWFSATARNVDDRAKINIEGANATEITTAYRGSNTSSSNSMNRLYKITPMPNNSSFSITFQNTDSYAIIRNETKYRYST